MGGASAYAWLYLVCGLFVAALVGIAAVLWWIGRGTQNAGHVHRIESPRDPPPDH